MAWASVIGAIDYSTDDNSLGFRIRENVILDVVSAMRQYDWSQMSAVRNAVLSRGTSWLVPSSSARVSQEFIDSLRKSEARAIQAAYPYQAQDDASIQATLADRGDHMREVFRQQFGGEPGSQEAAEAIRRLEEQFLPPLETPDTADAGVVPAAARDRLSFAERMKPRRAR